MKQVILLVIAIITSPYSFGQSNNDTIPFREMTVPSSPVFNLLDVSSMTVERPATVKAFALSVGNAVGGSTLIPKNFAMEFTPFWLFKHPRMDIYKYNGLTIDKDNIMNEPLKFKRNIFYGLRNFSVSIATVSKDSSESFPINTNYIGYSIRANIINIRKGKVLDSLKKSIDGLNNILVKDLKKAVHECQAIFDPETQLEEYHKCIDDYVFRDSVLINASRNHYDTLLKIRPVFTIDLAGASSTIFANNNFNSNHGYRSGAWITFGYSQPLTKDAEKTINGLFNAKNYLNIYGLFRILSNDSTTDFKTFTNQTLIDYGGRLEFEFNRLSISFESVFRTVKDVPDLNSSRIVGILQYKISDNLFFTGTFGKNFGTRENLLAFFGINWGLGKTTLYNKLKTE